MATLRAFRVALKGTLLRSLPLKGSCHLLLLLILVVVAVGVTLHLLVYVRLQQEDASSSTSRLQREVLELKAQLARSQRLLLLRNNDSRIRSNVLPHPTSLPKQRMDDGAKQLGQVPADTGCLPADEVPPCETVHICIVCAGHNSTRVTATLIKSILFHRRNPLHFHFVTSPSDSRPILETLFSTWQLPEVDISFYPTEDVMDDVAWIPNKHYSGVYGLLKLTLPKLFPPDLDKVIVLDTDLIFLSDIAKLWGLFKTVLMDTDEDSEQPHEERPALGLVENQSDWYIPNKLWPGHSPWPAVGRGYNTGVMLMHLARLKGPRWRWSNLWRQVAEKELTTMLTTPLADQDVVNAVVKDHPAILGELPCLWNVQLSFNTLSKSCYSSRPHEVKVAHFNSPKKFDAQVDENSNYFRNHFLTFLHFDGTLLRTGLINCSTNRSGHHLTPQRLDRSEVLDQACDKLLPSKDKIYRTHLYFLEYSSDTVGGDDGDVTLAAQLSVDRLHMLEDLCNHWPGPMSLALYMSDAETDFFVRFVQGTGLIRNRKNIGFHVVYKELDYNYPINYLRNVALKNVQTGHVFLSDVDFLPGLETYSILKRSVRGLFSQNGLDSVNNLKHEETRAEGKVALVVAAFETQRYRLPKFPGTKAEALYLLDVGVLLTFRYHVWTKGHKATDYAQWRTATKPYAIEWQPDYEPYVVLPTKDAPLFDTRFAGFGWNKVSYTMELEALGFQFVVLPNAFAVHMPHAPSPDISKFRSSERYRRCLRSLKEDFVHQMKTKYGRVFSLD